MQEDAVGIVLAGGRSRRLAALGLGPAGKAALLVGGQTCLERVCRVVGTVVPRVIVVAAEGQPLPGLPDDVDVDVVRDARPAGGPLAALLDGLRQAVGHEPPPRFAFVTSCDAPLLSAAVVRLLLDLARSSAARAVVPVVAGHRQVLVSTLACDLLGSIEAAVDAGGGVRALLDRLSTAEPAAVRLVAAEELAAVDPGLGSFFDIDTPEDLARLEALGFPSSRG
ncbi:MAG: NTP transferase domain-containing protein [Planctomycetia bacterium]|nr:NTP transferase domain-containing protein [Planctomycetia bacterium]